MLKIKNLVKTYARAKKPTLNGLSLDLKKGEIFGFLGSNGAGKTTTIKCISGILPFESGEVLINGISLTKKPKEAKMNLAYISDNHAVYERLTGREYVNHIANLYGIPEDVREERAERYIAEFNLTQAYDRQIKSYSHGMKQKISVVAALVHDPKLWVLDEPLLGLDPTSAYTLKQMMREHAEKGNTVFFSSHILEVVESLCDRIGILRNGVIEHIFDLNEIRQSGQTLEEIYVKYVATPNAPIAAETDKNHKKITKNTKKTIKKHKFGKNSTKDTDSESANQEKEGYAGENNIISIKTIKKAQKNRKKTSKNTKKSTNNEVQV